MGLRINTNIQALDAHKNLTKTDGLLGQSLARLSSGLRINKAADDASGLAIADTLRAQHTGIGQSIANANDGVNIIQIADGALEESLNIVNTIRTKSIQAASDGQSATSRKAIQADVNKLLEELDMIGNTTAYNGTNLLDGGFTNKSFHVGAYKDQVVGVSIGDARGTKIGAMAYAKTERQAEAAVSSPFVKLGSVTSETLSAGNIKLNNIQIGSSQSMLAGVGSAGTAWAKAAIINAKTNETGVAAKATTEIVVSVGARLSGASINGIEISLATTGATLVSLINNSTSAKKNNIRAELVGGNANAVRLIADDGRNLKVKASGGDMYVNGLELSGATTAGTITQRGTLTLSNARTMTNSDKYVQSATLNAGELVINGIDVAKGGSLTVQKGDRDKTLVNAINNNTDLQKLGIRAELYADKGDAIGSGAAASEYRIRLISTRDDITISGTDPNKVAQLKSGTTTGTDSSSINIGGALADTDLNADNYMRRIGLGGSQYGTSEATGVNNVAGNDLVSFGKDRLNYKSGDVEINGYKIGEASDDGISHAKGDMSAAALAAAINLVKAETGVEADIIKASQAGAGMVKAGTLQQRDLVINGIDIVRDNSGGSGMAIKDGDADHTLMNAINEYKTQTGVMASINEGGKLVLSATDGRNIHVQSTANGNKFAKFEADFGEGKGVAQDSVYMGNVKLVSDATFKVDGAGSSGAAKEISLLKMGLAGGGASTEATSDLKGDGTITAGVNYKTAMAKVDVTTQEGAEQAIRTADYAIKRLDELRSGLGSTQNQLTSTISNLSVTKINIQATESTIRDVDFAAESTTFSKMQVLMQAGTYAQSQANAMSQNVMRLLQ